MEYDGNGKFCFLLALGYAGDYFVCLPAPSAYLFLLHLSVMTLLFYYLLYAVDFFFSFDTLRILSPATYLKTINHLRLTFTVKVLGLHNECPSGHPMAAE